jgi:hypothetical protein
MNGVALPMRRPLLALALALTCWCLAPSPIASAAIYAVDVCSAIGHDGITLRTRSAVGISQTDGCGNPADGGITQHTDTDTSPVSAGVDWKLTAPFGTHITTVDADLSFGGTWASTGVNGFESVNWVLTPSSITGNAIDELTAAPGPAGTPLPPPQRATYTVDGDVFESDFFCIASTSGCSAALMSVRLGNIVAHFDDPDRPTVARLGGSLLAGGTLSGTKELLFNAVDTASGVAEVDLLVDGETVASFTDLKGGQCVKPYHTVVPCDLNISSSLSLDTASVVNGGHELQVAVTDAAGNRALTVPVTITIGNPPPALVSAPLVTGETRIGGRLFVSTGIWTNNPFTFRYQWLRCNPDVAIATAVTSCTPVLGATGASLLLAREDVFQRIIAEVFAINGGGVSEPALTAPTAPIVDELGRTSPTDTGTGTGTGTGGPGSDATPPVLSNVSLSRTRFRVARRASTLRLTSSEGGTLSLLIERARPGRKVTSNGKLVCHAVRFPAFRGRCTAYVQTGTLARAIAAGRTSVVLDGRVAGRRLTPGRYRLTITVRDAAGNVSQAKRLTFAIVRG